MFHPHQTQILESWPSPEGTFIKAEVGQRTHWISKPCRTGLPNSLIAKLISERRSEVDDRRSPNAKHSYMNFTRRYLHQGRSGPKNSLDLKTMSHRAAQFIDRQVISNA